MSFATSLRCRECGRDYPITPSHVCEYCFGPLEVAYDYDAMKKAVSRESIQQGPASVWRYRDLLPCEGEPVDLQPATHLSSRPTTSPKPSASTTSTSRTTAPTPPGPSRTA